MIHIVNIRIYNIYSRLHLIGPLQYRSWFWNEIKNEILTDNDGFLIHLGAQYDEKAKIKKRIVEKNLLKSLPIIHHGGGLYIYILKYYVQMSVMDFERSILLRDLWQYATKRQFYEKRLEVIVLNQPSLFLESLVRPLITYIAHHVKYFKRRSIIKFNAPIIGN